MQIFLVGGAVRDKLLGRPIKDRDWVVVGSNPEEMLSRGFTSVGKDFPVFLHPDTKEEYALARTERKTGKGYTGFEFHAAEDVTLEQDLARRDLTINAIAESSDGHIIDPFDGQADINKKLLRHVSPAFCEDPVRVLRVARFAARYYHLGFSVAEETTTMMKHIVDSGEVNHLVAERVWAELNSALQEKSPAEFFNVLRSCGALKVIFPEIHNLFGVPQPAKHHPEIDTGVHTLMSLEQACQLSDDPLIRFATLTHDLGKAVTPKNKLPSHHGHESESKKLVDHLCDRLKAPNDYRALAIMTAEYHTHCHRAFELKPTTILKMLEKLDAFRRPERFNKFLLCCEADARGRTGFENREYPQREFLMTQLAVANKIDIKSLLEQGKEKQQLGDAIRKARIDALRKAASNHE